jgi:hypothetical protein
MSSVIDDYLVDPKVSLLEPIMPAGPTTTRPS